MMGQANAGVPELKGAFGMTQSDVTPVGRGGHGAAVLVGAAEEVATFAAWVAEVATSLAAAGMAMRKPEGKEMGYVLLPLFLETPENETIEEALE
jgi:hypothetical protein